MKLNTALCKLQEVVCMSVKIANGVRQLALKTRSFDNLDLNQNYSYLDILRKWQKIRKS